MEKQIVEMDLDALMKLKASIDKLIHDKKIEHYTNKTLENLVHSTDSASVINSNIVKSMIALKDELSVKDMVVFIDVEFGDTEKTLFPVYKIDNILTEKNCDVASLKHTINIIQSKQLEDILKSMAKIHGNLKTSRNIMSVYNLENIYRLLKANANIHVILTYEYKLLEFCDILFASKNTTE